MLNSFECLHLLLLYLMQGKFLNNRDFCRLYTGAKIYELFDLKPMLLEPICN